MTAVSTRNSPGPIQMGPFNGGGLTNLYATQQARQAGPTPPGLPAFPAHVASDFIIWAYDQRLIYADSSALIGYSKVGAVDLTVSAYTSAYAPVPLPLPPSPPPPDTSAILTLAIDNTGVTTQQVTGIVAYTASGTLAPQTGTGECPAYDVGPGGYVAISTTVQDANGHLWSYYVDAQYGHGNEVGVACPPGIRGYRINPLTGASAGVCGTGDPDYGCKGWVGGADVAYFPCAPAFSTCPDILVRHHRPMVSCSACPMNRQTAATSSGSVTLSGSPMGTIIQPTRTVISKRLVLSLAARQAVVSCP